MCYSLVKQLKGSNVTGTELLETLIKPKENLECSRSKKEWLLQLDNVIENGFISFENEDINDLEISKNVDMESSP